MFVCSLLQYGFRGEGADEECPYEDSEVDVPSDKEVYDPK